MKKLPEIFQGSENKIIPILNSNIKRRKTRYSCHTHRFQWYWFLTVTSRQLKTLEKNVESVELDF